METINLGYSTKNIPTAKPCDYKRSLIEKTELLIRRMRWKAFFFLNPDKKPNQLETYGFKSTAPTPHIKDLEQFESSMLHLVQNIKFKSYTNDFQKQLQIDLAKI